MNIEPIRYSARISTGFSRLPAVVILLTMAIYPCVAVADYQAGLSAYQQGQYDRAFEEWINVAVSPDGAVDPAVRAESQYAIGMLFWIGQGVQQDTAAAANWLTEAAELNHAGAQLKLGYLYLTGDGLARNDFEAFKWLQMAASQGEPDAQYNLGVMYRDGLGVEANNERALQWFHEAAARGDPVSARIVAEYQKTGRLPRNTAAIATGSVDQVALAENPVMAESSPRAAESPVENVSVPETTAVAPMVGDENWIQGQNPQNFTIQVIALLDREKLEQFILDHPGYQPFAIYQSEWNEKPLWVLIQGNYPDRDSATSVASRFPNDLQPRDKMWIRQFDQVQSQLK